MVLINEGVWFQLRLQATGDCPPERGLSHRPFYHECQEHVHPGHNTQLKKEAQKDSGEVGRQAGMEGGEGE